MGYAEARICMTQPWYPGSPQALWSPLSLLERPHKRKRAMAVTKAVGSEGNKDKTLDVGHR